MKLSIDSKREPKNWNDTLDGTQNSISKWPTFWGGCVCVWNHWNKIYWSKFM